MAIKTTQNNPQNLAPIFRTESSGHISWYPYPNYPYRHAEAGAGGDEPSSLLYPLYSNNNKNNLIEKRQLFLRSYQFSRKKSLGESLKCCLIRARRVFWYRLRSVKKMKKLVWSKLRFAVYYRRRRLVRLMRSYYYSFY